MKAKKTNAMGKNKVANFELTRFFTAQIEPVRAVSLRSRASKRPRLGGALVRYLPDGKMHIWKLGN
jgi:hypothetical protein